MGLNTRRNESFAATVKNAQIEGSDVIFIKGGSTVIGDKWIQFNDLRLDVGDLVDSWISTRARRIFNKKNGILNVLIALTKDQKIEVIPSISLNQTSAGNVSSFENIDNRLPIALVKLTQDGSNDLSSYLPLSRSDIKQYRGYGNFTLQGSSGLTGPFGDTGIRGVYGENGDIGLKGQEGLVGDRGLAGAKAPLGATGSEGDIGESVYRYLVTRVLPPSADFSGSPLSGINPLSVVFTNLSTGSWESLLWDFGDGNTSTDSNPTHVYDDEGVYTVKLFLDGIEGISEEIKYDYITVTETCVIQNTVDLTSPEGVWQHVVNSSVDTIQNTVSNTCS